MRAMTAEAVSERTSVTACALCGGTDFVPRFGAAARDLPVEGHSAGYRITHSERKFVGAIVRCRGCGLVLLPQPWAGLTAYGEGADPYYIEQASERIANSRKLLSLVPHGGRLLEVGCACGFLLVAARELGFEVEGIEASEWASEYARREYGVSVQTGHLESCVLPEGRYDVVVMADTIEHLRDPRSAVRTIARALKAGGRLVVLTPDAGSVVARVAGRRWWGLLDDHYFYFSRATLRRLLESEGLIAERCVAFGRRFTLSHWIGKLSQYNPSLCRTVAWAARTARIGWVPVSVNVGDQMACVARKE